MRSCQLAAAGAEMGQAIAVPHLAPPAERLRAATAAVPRAGSAATAPQSSAGVDVGWQAADHWRLLEGSSSGLRQSRGRQGEGLQNARDLRLRWLDCRVANR